VSAYKNKWGGDWASFWFYHKVPLDPVMKSNPLVAKTIGELGENPTANPDEQPEHAAFLAMLREVSKVLGTRDIMEEYCACQCSREVWVEHQDLAPRREVVSWHSDAELRRFIQLEKRM
jgi:hypothetical protein